MIEAASTTASHGNVHSYSSVSDDDPSLATLWRALALNNKLYSSRDIAEAHRLWKAKSTPKRHLSTDRFIDLAIKDVASAKAVDFTLAVATSTTFDLWDLMKFFQKIPPTWKSRLSASRSLEEAARVVARRFCANISKSRFHESTLFTVLADTSGLSHQDIANEALAALADMPVLDPYRLFSLASLLVQNLDREQAAESLTFGLSLLEAQLSAGTGDGGWGSLVRPDADIEDAMAGFLYAKLASPVAHIRWQAAHVIVEAGSGGRCERSDQPSHPERPEGTIFALC
jgi:hypothetical protein